MPRRVIIVGGPRTGKSTLSERLAKEFGVSTLHTSAELENLFPVDRPESWSQHSDHASKWFDDPGDWICEGVQMARALRKWLRANPDKPLDADLFLLRQPMVPQRDGQKAMMKGVETVFREIEPELIKRGARIQKLKDPERAIDILQSAGPANSESLGESSKMALKASITKDEFDALAEPLREHYKASSDGQSFVLEAEGIEDVAGLKASQQRMLDEVKDLKERAKVFKDVDPEKYKQLLADAEEREREGKKKSNDWEGWKETFEKSKEKEINALKDEISARDSRIHKFLLEDKVRAAGLENGIRKESVERMIRDVLHPDRPRFRLDEKENIEVLSDSGSPMDLKIDSFFKDIYKQEASEYYEGHPVQGGSGASNGTNGGSARGTDLSKLSPTERLKVANRSAST